MDNNPNPTSTEQNPTARNPALGRWLRDRGATLLHMQIDEGAGEKEPYFLMFLTRASSGPARPASYAERNKARQQDGVFRQWWGRDNQMLEEMAAQGWLFLSHQEGEDHAGILHYYFGRYNLRGYVVSEWRAQDLLDAYPQEIHAPFKTLLVTENAGCALILEAMKEHQKRQRQSSHSC